MMNQWESYFINDPYDDYNLVIEILCDDVDVAVIQQRQQGLFLRWYVIPKGLIIPVDWLSSLLLRAKEGLIEPNPMIKESVTNQWTASWGNSSDNDCNHIVLIYCDGSEIARIKQGEQGEQELILECYPAQKDLVIPVDWLSKLLLDAKEKRIDKNL